MNWQKRKPASEYEKFWVKKWADDEIFAKSVAKNPAGKSYVFYDGPPFITGVPHFGTLLSSIVKDAVPRYWTMKGFRVERKWGWDCHGLPAENFVEKELGITDRKQILTDEKHRFEPLENVDKFAKNEENSGLKISRIPRKEWEKSAENLAPKNEKTGEKLPVFSLEKYIETARKSMRDNSETWKPVISRVGRWVDMSSPYRTMNPDFMESVWWAFAKLFKAGKIYEGAKVLMYDTHFATPVAKAEVTMDNDAYKTVSDPSVYVKFALENSENFAKKIGIDTQVFANSFRENADQKTDAGEQRGVAAASEISILAWTTTPWTLPGNTALAVNEKMNYVLVKFAEKNSENASDFADFRENYFILARDLAEQFFAKNGISEYEILAEFSGEKLVGEKYKPLFPDEIFAENPAKNYYKNDEKNFAKIWNADYVSDENGTGIVHIAPIYGEEDYALAKKNQIPARETMDENGFYWPEISRKIAENFAKSFGENYAEILKKADVKIDENGNFEAFSVNKIFAKSLEKLGVVWKIETIRHEYPFNPRSGQRIMYRAIPSWFFDVQSEKPLLISQNENINWFPKHLKHGRFQKNIEAAPDWNLSRNRFWASAMPVWKGDKGGIIVVESYDELAKLSGVRLDDYHRPWVDEIKIFANNQAAEVREKYKMEDDEIFTRIPEVLDGWFESGSMPFAQLHYPFENREKFERNYPADFIVEYIGQVRAWFYYVHLVNTSLAEIGAFNGEDFAKNPENREEIYEKSGELEAFKNVITTGVVAGNDGRKMSKSLGNFTDPNILMDQFSADSLRFLLLNSPLLNGEDFALKDKDVSDVFRKLNMIWNVYDFFAMYAESENFVPEFFAKFDETPENPSEKFAKFAENFAPENLKSPLDKWIVSRISELRENITKNMDEYNIPEATNEILPFLDDLSNWFLRRSRRRFSRNPDENDKKEAFETLHFILTETAVLLAPFTPFLAEELFAKLTKTEDPGKAVRPAASVRSTDDEFREMNSQNSGKFGKSVHLLDWPAEISRDEKVLATMKKVREIIQEGLRLRMEKDEFSAQIKIRQSLAKLKYSGEKLDEFYEKIIADEVNVKSVEFVENLAEYFAKNYDENNEKNAEVSRKIADDSDGKFAKTWVELDKKITPKLKKEGLSREIIRAVQSARKFAKFKVDDKIRAGIFAENREITEALLEFSDEIDREILSVGAIESDEIFAKIPENEKYIFATKIDGANVEIRISKVREK